MVPLRVVFLPSSSPHAGIEQVPIMHDVCWHSRFALQRPVLVDPPAPVAIDIPAAPPVEEDEPPVLPPEPAPAEEPPVALGGAGFCLTPAHAATVKTTMKEIPTR